MYTHAHAIVDVKIRYKEKNEHDMLPLSNGVHVVSMCIVVCIGGCTTQVSIQLCLFDCVREILCQKETDESIDRQFDKSL